MKLPQDSVKYKHRMNLGNAMDEKIKDFDGLKISYQYIDKKNDVNLFLVHGWGGTKHSLEKLAKKLSTVANVYLLDLPGFGDSDNPPKDWGPYEYSMLVSKWIADFQTKNNIYFGHSFGGGIGAILASTQPELFTKLILCGSAIYRDPKVAKSVALLQKLPFYSTLKNSLKGIKGITYRALFRKSDSYKYQALESNYRKIIQTDLSQHSQNINMPTLILWGDEDQDTPVSDAYRLQKAISGAILTLYSGYGHGLPKLNSEIITEDIVKFITQ